MSIDMLTMFFGFILAFITIVVIVFAVKSPNREVLFYIDDDGVPQHCFEDKMKKMSGVEFYSSVAEVNQAVKKQVAQVENASNRLGSHLVSNDHAESYSVTVAKNASPEEVRASLFHLNQFRLHYNGKPYPAITATDTGYGYVRYSFPVSSGSSGQAWNDLMFPNVDWVENLVDDGQPISNIKYLETV